MKQLLKKLGERHNMPVVKACAYELFIRAYQQPLFRGLIRPLLSPESPKQWLFVVGCYNSGTTIIKNVIAAHPDVNAAPVEGDTLTSELSTFENNQWPRCLIANWYGVLKSRELDVIDYRRILSDWAPWIDKEKSFLEKSIANAVRIKNIIKSFPNAKFVCVVRDPESVVLGILKRSRPGDDAAALLGVESYPVELLLRQWIYIYTLVLKDLSDSNNILYCNYEEFITNPVAATKNIHRFYGLKEVRIEYAEGKLFVDRQCLEIRSSQKGRSPSDIFHGLEQLSMKADEILRQINNIRKKLVYEFDTSYQS